MMRTSFGVGFALLGCLLGAPTGYSQKPGDTVVIIQDSELQTPQKTVRRGEVARVVAARGNVIWLRLHGVVGTIDPLQTLPVKHGADYFTKAIQADPKDSSAYFGRASVREALGDYDRTITDCGEALRLDPKNVLAMGVRARARMAKHEIDKALDDFGETIRIEPENAEWRVARGRLWSSIHKYAKAIADFSEALRLEPENVDIYYALATARFANGEFATAAGNCTRILARIESPAVYLLRGRCRQALGEFAAADDDYSNAIRLKNKTAADWFREGLGQLSGGNFTRAALFIELVQAEIDDVYQLYWFRGESRRRSGQDYAGAIRDFEEVIWLAPKLPDGYFGRGACRLTQQEYESAINDAEAYNNRGFVWHLKGKEDKAIADYNQAIAINPRHSYAYCNRGTSWGIKGDYDKAIADCNRALAVDPKNSEAYNSRAFAWQRKGQDDKAIADYNEALRIDPKCAMAYNNRGWRLCCNGKYDEAIADYNRAIAVDPKLDLAYNNLAWLQATCPDEKHRDGKKAVENAHRAYQLTAGKNCGYIDTLAAAYAENRDFEKAKQWQAKALEMAPDEKGKQELRARLYLYKQGKPYREALKKKESKREQPEAK